MKFRQGFTLIELMIVMAIIGILAVALAPSLMGAQSTARDTQRQADMRNIKMVIQDFQQRYKQFPQTAFCVDGSVSQTSDADFTSKGTAGAMTYFDEQFEGGVAPKDPTDYISITVDTITDCNGYVYVPMAKNGNSRSATSYVILGPAESDKNVQIDCSGFGGHVGGDFDVTDIKDTAAMVPADLMSIDPDDRCMYSTGG